MGRIIEPLGDRVIVKRSEGASKIGELFVPDNARQKPQEGKVLAVGEGAKMEDGSRLSVDVEVGDIVLFGMYSGQEVVIDDMEFLILTEGEIFGRLRDATPEEEAEAEKRQ